MNAKNAWYEIEEAKAVWRPGEQEVVGERGQDEDSTLSLWDRRVGSVERGKKGEEKERSNR